MVLHPTRCLRGDSAPMLARAIRPLPADRFHSALAKPALTRRGGLVCDPSSLSTLISAPWQSRTRSSHRFSSWPRQARAVRAIRSLPAITTIGADRLLTTDTQRKECCRTGSLAACKMCIDASPTAPTGADHVHTAGRGNASASRTAIFAASETRQWLRMRIIAKVASNTAMGGSNSATSKSASHGNCW